MILAQLTDTHCRPSGLAAMRVCETNMLTERAFRALAAVRPVPDALLYTGDLAANGLASEYAVVAELLARLVAMPVYAIPGNHDDRAAMRAGLGHLPGLSEGGAFIQYAVDSLPVRLVMLDTVIPGSPVGELCAARLAWLDATLSAAPERPTLIAMHHPPFRCGIRHMDTLNLRNAEDFTAIIARNRQVRRIVCGHHHRPVMAPVAHAMASIATSVAHQVELDLATDAPTQWFLEPAAFQLHVWLDEIFVSHTSYVESYPGPFPFLTDT
jgi:Icc protein